MAKNIKIFPCWVIILGLVYLVTCLATYFVTHSQWVYVYVFSVFFGGLITLIISRVLRYLTNRINKNETDDSKYETIDWIPISLGIIERITITTLVGYKVSAAGAFIGAWIVVKSAIGWQVWKSPEQHDTKYERALVYTGLLGSIISALIGIIGGIMLEKIL